MANSLAMRKGKRAHNDIDSDSREGVSQSRQQNLPETVSSQGKQEGPGAGQVCVTTPSQEQHELTVGQTNVTAPCQKKQRLPGVSSKEQQELVVVSCQGPECSSQRKQVQQSTTVASCQGQPDLGVSSSQEQHGQVLSSGQEQQGPAVATRQEQTGAFSELTMELSRAKEEIYTQKEQVKEQAKKLAESEIKWQKMKVIDSMLSKLSKRR